MLHVSKQFYIHYGFEKVTFSNGDWTLVQIDSFSISRSPRTYFSGEESYDYYYFGLHTRKEKGFYRISKEEYDRLFKILGVD